MIEIDVGGNQRINSVVEQFTEGLTGREAFAVGIIAECLLRWKADKDNKFLDDIERYTAELRKLSKKKEEEAVMTAEWTDIYSSIAQRIAYTRTDGSSIWRKEIEPYISSKGGLNESVN